MTHACLLKQQLKGQGAIAAAALPSVPDPDTDLIHVLQQGNRSHCVAPTQW